MCYALDMPPRTVAAAIGVPYTELKPLLHPMHVLAPVNRDETWARVAALVNERLGHLLGARQELDRALQSARAKQVADRAERRASRRTLTR